MIELSNERIEQILHEETAKKEELDTILRGIYTRYMLLYENYLADIDALNEDKIAEMRNYHEETGSLIKYYYMDIPQDICILIEEFEKEYNSKLLGPGWHEFLFSTYEEFKGENQDEEKSEELLKAEFSEQALSYFYKAMDYVFREGFDTESKTVEQATGWLSGQLFEKA